MVTNARHIALLNQAEDSLDAVLQGLDSGMPVDHAMVQCVMPGGFPVVSADGIWSSYRVGVVLVNGLGLDPCPGLR